MKDQLEIYNNYSNNSNNSNNRSKNLDFWKDDLLIWQVVFITSLIIANVVAGKVIMLFDFFVLPAAVVSYAITFLCTDVIHEKYGKQEAKNTIHIGLIALVLGSILITIAGLLPVAPFLAERQEAFDIILGQNYRFVFASLVAYYVSQLLDINVFGKLKERFGGKHKWLRNNTSTMCAQFIDTCIFITIAFAGVVPSLFVMIFSQYIFKIGLAAIDTPLFYFFTRKEKERKLI